jgi:hypothetical protein
MLSSLPLLCAMVGGVTATPGLLEPALQRLVSQHGAAGGGGPGQTAHTTLTALSRRHRHRPPPVALRTPLAFHCPLALQESINTTGLLPVDYFRADNRTCDEATRLAINASQHGCGGTIYFASPCAFEATVVVPGGTGLRGGGGGGSDQFGFKPQTQISGPSEGPAFLVQHTTSVEFMDLEILGWNTGVIVTDSALVRFNNVAIHASSQGKGMDDVDLSPEGCTAAGCNVVLGSNNTALVIEK